MSERSIEAHGVDVDAAIAAGLQQLGLTQDQVIVEVVDEGRRGLLGLGSREATVRLTPLPRPSAPTAPAGRPEPSKAPEPAARAEAETPAAPAARSAPAPEPVRQPRQQAHADEDDDWAASDVIAGEPDEETAAVALEVVSELLNKMHFRNVEISVEHTEPDDKTGRVMTVVRVEGNGLGTLIGARGETLDNLQYLARLMAGHELKRRANFLVDIDNFRERRRETLTNLAVRTAEKAIRRNRAVTLEAMSAYDRRIIHMALRDHETVYTSSVGEGAERRVRIYIKNR